MSGPNFRYINQFKRNGHEPLPQAKPQPIKEIEWLPGGEWVEKDAEAAWARTGVLVQHPSNVGKSLSMGRYSKIIFEHILAGQLNAYPRPPQGTPRFWPKNSIPRGISDKHPFGDPSIRYRGHMSFGGMIIRPLEREFLEDWIKNIASMR
ncbi:hypothetical protein AVU38_gp216 [Ralstonia phage RSL2]|uniref:Uncharacterized protein n=1 Tax=Ralstonia phage RSL2 TaxID=1585840 RepID=A0A0A8J9R4_9CAUD|nr:hypothetical protein AVU38_gp216 [Ralstonia phage RSL2]BAQ02744.1 hypothetical protein [Ralstonia phage RSL2]